MLALTEHRIRTSCDTPNLQRRAQEQGVLDRLIAGKFREVWSEENVQDVEVRDGYALLRTQRIIFIVVSLVEKRRIGRHLCPFGTAHLHASGVVSLSGPGKHALVAKDSVLYLQQVPWIGSKTSILLQKEDEFIVRFSSGEIAIPKHRSEPYDEGDRFWAFGARDQVVIVDPAAQTMLSHRIENAWFRAVSCWESEIAVLFETDRHYIRLLDARTGKALKADIPLNDRLTNLNLTRAKIVAWKAGGDFILFDKKDPRQTLTAPVAESFAFLETHCIFSTFTGLKFRYYGDWANPREIAIQNFWKFTYPYVVTQGGGVAKILDYCS